MTCKEEKEVIIHDNSTWVIAGNIVTEHPREKEDNSKFSGTNAFRPGAKVYLATLIHNWLILNPEKQWHLQVLGQHKKSRSWVVNWVDSTLIENWRIQITHKPKIIERLKKEEWKGFSINFECESELRSKPENIKKIINSLIEA